MNVQLRNGLFGLSTLALLSAGGLQASGSAFAVVGFLAAALLLCAGLVVFDARRGALATAAVCLGANAYLLYQKVGAGAGPSMCNVNDVLNCDVVNTSAASELFGVPVTLFGVAFYLGLAVAALLPKASAPRFHQVNGLFALISLLFSAYLAYEATKLPSACVMCITIYIGNGLLLWSAYRGLQGSRLFGDLTGVAYSNSALAITATFVLLLLVLMPQYSVQGGGSEAITRSSPTSGQPAERPAPMSAVAQLYNQPRGEITLGGNEPVYGDPSAPYVLLEFADYGCPHCAHAAKDLKQLVAQFPEVQVRFRVFPLTSSCNPALQQDSSPERCQAAYAVHCAGEQGKFWDLNALLFANQGRFSNADLTFMAGQVGVKQDVWRECMAASSTQEAILADAMAGAKAGLMGTPAMFLRGTHGPDWIEVRDASAAAKVIEAHLTGASLPTPSPPPAY
jgi:protein-disulfide isomerase/uncharacterized membrane protein